MKASFNVLDREWIPVRTEEGTILEMGIRQVLTQAHELKEISIASPMEEYSLYRFLSVFLMDALRPESIIDIEDLIGKGKFDMDLIECYIEQCQDEGVSFDLFDKKRPFLQSVYSSSIDKEKKPASVLDYTIPNGNNHTHFDHRRSSGITISVEKAARLLLTVQLFCTAGAQGYPSGVNASPPYFEIIMGDNLFETLVYSLTPVENIGFPFDDPMVLWRETGQIQPKKEVTRTSWLQGMLFPSRRVSLIPNSLGNGVDSVYYCQGENFVNKEIWKDPFVTYRTTKAGIIPLRPSKDRPIWHNLNDIIDIPGKHASLLLTQYVEMMNPKTISIMLYGVETNQASYLSVSKHSLSFPSKLTHDEQSIGLLTRAITASERLASSLNKCMVGIPSIPKSTAKMSIYSYYKKCELLFWKLCNEVADSGEEKKELYLQWCIDTSDIVKKVFHQTLSSLHLRADSMVEAEEMYGALLKETRFIIKEANE